LMLANAHTPDLTIALLLLKNADTAEDSTHALLRELLEIGLEVHCCGSSLQAQGIQEVPGGVEKGSMKGLSAWISAADEVVCF
ncbi:DsrE family protein, partial [Acidithiobacillus sp.]|uniref:DsrE family protein n=1 Tax=Acidithiobacillus sp. TaxID=1872118 RepID=UPI003D03867E